MERKNADDFDPELLDLFDQYVHGGMDRRQFLERASRFAVGGHHRRRAAGEPSPHYAWAQQVPADDARIQAEYASYPSPQGHGTMKGYLARPRDGAGKRPAVLVVHENRGLNPYIEDVARRLAVGGLRGLRAGRADARSAAIPATTTRAASCRPRSTAAKIIEDMVAGAAFCEATPDCNGKLGVIGFCFGGGVSNTLAVRMPDLAAAVPFYGGQPPAEDVPKIKAALLLHYAGNDKRVNAGWPAYETALKANKVDYTAHIYPRAPTTGSTTTPRRATTRPRPSWPGSGRWTS